MSRKTVIYASILMSAAALSATAHAGSTITDKSYWPGEIRQQTRAASPQKSPSDSFAFDVRPGTVVPTARAGAWTYTGGPKGR